MILDAIKTAVLIELLYGDDDVEEEENECTNPKATQLVKTYTYLKCPLAEKVVVNNKPEHIQSLINNKKLIDKIEELKELQVNLFEDFGGYQDLLRSLIEDMVLIDAWYVMSSDEKHRVDLKNLQKIRDYLKEPYQELPETSFVIDLKKLKYAFDESNNKISFILRNSSLITKTDFCQPDFNTLIKFKEELQKQDNQLTFTDRKGNTYTQKVSFDELELGFSGVMAPGGETAYQLTANISKLYKIFNQKIGANNLEKQLANLIKIIWNFKSA